MSRGINEMTKFILSDTDNLIKKTKESSRIVSSFFREIIWTESHCHDCEPQIAIFMIYAKGMSMLNMFW